MRKVYLFCLVLLFGSFFKVSFSYAADFSFNYNVSYNVSESGNTHVKQHVTLTNEVTDIYAQNYTLIITSDKIDNVTASDGGGVISPQITRKDGQTIITLPFTTKVVGKNKTNPFTLEYDSHDIARKNGRIWEIIIPGIARNETLNAYTIHLSVPPSFGSPAYVSPATTQAGVWTLAQHQGHGIAAAYGIFQNFAFNLKYHLENTTIKAQMQEITLPPDMSFQKIIISHISELPQNVIVDHDGNWLAQYKLLPAQKKEILVEGNALVYATPQLQTQQELTSAQREVYTAGQKYWEQTPQIIAKAEQLGSPQAIYDYVVGTLTYDYNRVIPGITRLGAAEAFTNPSRAICMEFSDLFVALARAAKIPAREIHGFAYTTNSRLQPLSLLSDVLHAWPQYWDQEKKLWISVDPTWGNTTRGVDYFNHLDFNHLAFAILGQKSDYPYPAGAFRNETSTKDVFVDISSEAIEVPNPTYELQLDNSLVVSGKPSTINLKISNVGSILYSPKKIYTNVPWVIAKNESQTGIPPYGFQNMPLVVAAPLVWTTKNTDIIITVDGKTLTTTIRVQPFYLPFLPWIVLLIGVVAVGFVILKRHDTRLKN